MRAKQLEQFLMHETITADFSDRLPREIPERLERLRGYGLLPRGPRKFLEILKTKEVAAGVLSIVTGSQGYAGHGALILTKLQPVGGEEASFQNASTFGEAVETLLTDNNARDSLIEVRASTSEIYNNSNCRASICYRSGADVRIAHYVSGMATSLLGPGAEDRFDTREIYSSVVPETTFYPNLFNRLCAELLEDDSKIDIEQDDEELTKERRAKRLGFTNSSRFLNVGVDNQVTWPKEETLVAFEGHKFILLPKTGEHTTSVHIDLHGNKLSSETALSLINRFLSLMTWCDDQFAICHGGWSGNPVPVPVRKRDLAFTTAHWWTFNRKIPASPEARKAIAIYRDARNAEQNYLVSYAVLAYYKIIEIRYKGRGPAKNWFRDNFSKIKQHKYLDDDIERFEQACGKEKPEDYLYGACRTAVAHANHPFSSDPDDIHELRRLHVATSVLRPLVREFISKELGVSDCFYDGS